MRNDRSEGSQHREFATPLIPLAALEQTVETGRLGFARFDVVSEKFVEVNARFCAMVGFSPEELLGNTVSLKDLTYPEDFERCMVDFRRLIRGEIESYTLEKRGIRKDRTVLPVRVTVTALERSPSDQVVRTVGFISAPAVPSHGDAILHHPGDSHGASFWTHEFMSRTGSCSDGFKLLLGRTADAPMPSFRDCIAQVHPEDRPRVIEDVRRVTKGLFHSSEFRIYRPDGELRWVCQSVSPIINTAGEVVGAVAGCLDITDAKRFARQTPSAQTVRSAKQYVDLNWDQPLSVTDLAKAVGVNARTLFKHFRQDCGFTPQEYLKRVRLNRARTLLQAADKATTVLGVALKCCFQNQGHFARDYRLAFGERPSETLDRARRLDTSQRTAGGDLSD